MLTTVQGIYEKGEFILDEPIPDRRVRIIVTILEEIVEPTTKIKRPFGISRGSIRMDDDFNASLDDLKEYM
ncbi:MAG: hypothetical protein EAZ32_03195 [Cytophagia bacterium]|nr:MAG: hypothetical protein EAZ38_05990 [Cytophagales bacterium]TAG41361.1 MAG: hypothetical protein EAZ32_03195 [Cytophagia bacterium]TAG83119.1 MAG: hypothetical protein EAZ22_03565 [Cytophagales bacterium]